MASGPLVQTRLDADEIGALDQYRRECANLPSRAAAMRELFRSALGIEAASKRHVAAREAHSPQFSSRPKTTEMR